MRVVTFLAEQQPERLASGQAHAYNVPVPTAELHADVAYNLALPRHERAWHFWHDERIPDFSKKILVKLDDVKAHGLLIHPTVRRWLKQQPLPQFTGELAKVLGSMQHWGSMDHVTVLAGVRAYFQETGLGLDEKKNQQHRLKKMEQHFASKGASVAPAVVSTRHTVQELASDFNFTEWEPIGGSKFIIEYGGKPAAYQLSVIDRLFGQRGIKIDKADGFSAYYIFMPTKTANQFSLLLDVATGDYQMRIPCREFSASGQDERGVPVWPKAPAEKGGPWRYSRTEFKWVPAAQEDDPAKLRTTYHIPEWFETVSGMWADAS